MFLYACNEVTPQENADTTTSPTGFSKYIDCAVEIPALAQWCAYNQVPSIGVAKSTGSVGSVGSVYDAGIGFANSTPITKGTAIRSIEDWQSIAQNLSANYYLAADLNAEGKDIGITKTFTGTLEGNGYVIYNITLANKQGIFSAIQNARVANLALGVMSINGSEVGALAGKSYDSVVENVAVAPMRVNKDVFHIQTSYSGGGLIGRSYGGRITAFNFGVNVSSPAGSGGYVGGIVGITDKERKDPITKIIGFSSANVSGHHVGGLVGGIWTTSQSKAGADYSPLINGYDGVAVGIVTGNVHGFGGTGGLVGEIYGGVIMGIVTGDISASRDSTRPNAGGLSEGSVRYEARRDGAGVWANERVAKGIVTSSLLKGGLSIYQDSGLLKQIQGYFTKDPSLSKTRSKEEWEKTSTPLTADSPTLCMVNDYALDSSTPPAPGSGQTCTEEIGKWTFSQGDWPQISMPRVVTQYWHGKIE